VKDKIAIGLAAAVIATGGLISSASAYPLRGYERSHGEYRHRLHDGRHGGVIDYVGKWRGQGSLHKRHIVGPFTRPTGPVYGKHKGPIPHYKGGRITDTWP
jgi:hypothetical protein